jgi:hypothetical protein
MKNTRYLTRKETSAYLKDETGIQRTAKTLAKLATIGGGPPFRKDGNRVLYDPEDLDDWAESILSPLVSSTAQLVVLTHTENSDRSRTSDTGKTNVE